MRFIECNYDAWDEAVDKSFKIKKFNTGSIYKITTVDYQNKDRTTKIYKVE